MDDIDLYEDLDEFQEQQERKSKELKEAEAKYQEALQTIHQLEEENKSLTKKLQRIELSFQSLLDTARTEIRRKDAEIERLRKEKDDICFRRRVPTHSKNVEQNQRSSASERRDEQRLPKCDAEKHPARNETSEDIQGNPIKRRLDSSPTIPSDKRRNTNDEYHRNTGKISAQDASYSSRCKDKKDEVNPVRQSYKEKYWERRDERDRRSHYSPSTKRRNECRKRSPDHRDHQRSHHRDRESKNKSDYERENEYKRSHSHRSDSRKTENHVTSDGDSHRFTEHLPSSKDKEMKNLGSRTPPTLESNNRIPSDNQSSINESDNKPKKDFRKEEEKSKCFVAKNNEINPEEGPPKDNVAGSSNRSRNDQKSCKSTLHTSSKENLCDAIFQRLDADSKRMDTLKLHHDKLDLYEVLYEDLTKDSEESKMPTNHQTATNLYDTLYEDLTEDPKEISNKTSNDQTGTDVCDMLYDDLDTKPREEANENMKTQTKDNVCDVLYDYLDEESKGKREQPKSSTDQISGKENGKPSSNEDVCVILHPALIQESQKNVNITRPSNTPRKDVLFNALFGPSPSTTESSSGGTPKNIINRNLEMGSKTTSPSEYSDIDSGPNSKNNQPTSFNKMELEKCFVPNDAKLTKNVIDLTEQEEEEGDICDNEKGVDFKGYTADKQTGNSNENRNAQNNTNIQIPGLDLLMVSLTKDILKTSKRIDEITAATKTQEVSMTRDSSLEYKAKDLQNIQCINEKVCPTTDTNQMSSLTENQNGKAVTRESSCRMTAGSNSGNSIESKQSEIYTINKEVEGPMKSSEITREELEEPLNYPKTAKPSETPVLFTNPNESSLKEDDIPNAVVDVAESSTKSAGHNNADSSPKMEFSSKETGKIHLQKSQLHVEHISDPVNTAEEVFHVNESEMTKSSKIVAKDVNLKEVSITANFLPSKSSAAVQNFEDTGVSELELKLPPKSLEEVLRTESVTSSKASEELDLPSKTSGSELGKKSDLFSLSETKAKLDPTKLETPTKTPTSKTLNISALSPEALSTCEKSDFTNLDSPLKLSKELENMCFKPITCIKSAKVSPKLDCRTTAALNTSKKPAVDSNYSNSEEPKSIQAQRDSPQLNCTAITPIKISKACESSPRVMQTLLYCDESLPADSTSNTPLKAAKELDTSSTSSKQNSSGCSSLDLTWSDGTPEKNKTIETESCSSKEFKQEGDPTNLIPQKAEVIKEKSVPKLQEDRKPIETTLENQEISNSKGDSNLGSSPELKTATKESEDLETSLIIIDDHQDDQDVLNSKSHLKPESPTKLHKDSVEPEDSDVSLIIVDDQELCDSKRDLNRGSPNHQSINEIGEPEEDSVVHNFFAVATNNSEIFELEEENMGEELEVSNPVISEGGVDEDRDLEPRVDNNLKLDRNVSTQNSNTFENNPKEANNNCLETYSKIPAMCQQSAMCPGQEKDELGPKKEMPESEEENLAMKTSCELVDEASAVRDKTTKENNGRASEQTKAPLVEDEQPSLISEDQKRHSILTKDIGNSSTEKFKTNISLKNLNTVEHFEESEKDKELKMHEAKVLASSEEKHKDSMVEQSEKCIENPSEEEDKDSMGGQSEKAVEKATEEKENLVMESPMKNKTPLKFSKETNLDYMEMANVASAPLEIAENSAKGNNGLEAKSKDEIENLANFSNEAKEVNVGSSDQGKFSLQPQLNLRFTKETNLADHDKTENHQENSDLTSKLANGTTETTGKEFENTSSLLSKDTSVGHASMPSLTKQKTDFKVPIPQNNESNQNNKTSSSKSGLEIVKFQSPSKTKLSPIINNTSSDCTTTLKSLSLNDCYNVPIVLPSISTSCPTPSNFSGIFSKNIHKSSSENLLENSNISVAKAKEFVLPAANVLCTVDNLKDATKTTTSTATTTMNLLNKKLHWELLEVNKDTIEIEDDSDADSSDEDKKLKIMEEEDQKDEIQNMARENAAEEEISPKGGLTCPTNGNVSPALETLEVKEHLAKDSNLKFSDKIKGSRTQERQKTKPLTVSPIRVRSAEKLMDKAILRLAMIKKKKLPLCLSYKSKCHRIAKKKPKLIAANSKQRKGKAKNGKFKTADTDDSRSTLGEILSSSMQEKLVLETVPKRDNLRRGRCLDENMRSVKGLETASFNEKVPFDLRGKGEGRTAAEKTIKAIDVSECHMNKNASSELRDNGQGSTAADELKKVTDAWEYHSPPSNKKPSSELRGNEEAIITAEKELLCVGI
uniref:CASP8-associated protein 2 n=1 Tax=Musca domestica TaxID=7370 RepID=A0A1I8N362_MUSDO